MRDHPSFIPVRLAHRHIHQSACKLLTELTTEETVHLDDYDDFTSGLDTFSLEVRHLERKIEGLLYHYDPLTGAGTRAVMLAEMTKLSELARQQIQTCCLVFMNFDQLRTIYDTYGHALGDQVLVAAIQFIKKQIRPFDSIFHYGNDTFLLSMPLTDLNTARKAVERVREKLIAAPLAYHQSKPVYMTASFGLTLLETTIGIDENIQRARHAAHIAQTASGEPIQAWDVSITAG